MPSSSCTSQWQLWLDMRAQMDALCAGFVHGADVEVGSSVKHLPNKLCTYPACTLRTAFSTLGLDKCCQLPHDSCQLTLWSKGSCWHD